MELKGYPCIGLKEQPATKKQIVVSRTFSRKITDLNSMNEAISDYTSRACEKLRKEDNELNIKIDTLKNKILYNNQNEI